jgi:hypothetical protein
MDQNRLGRPFAPRFSWGVVPDSGIWAAEYAGHRLVTSADPFGRLAWWIEGPKAPPDGPSRGQAATRFAAIAAVEAEATRLLG